MKVKIKQNVCRVKVIEVDLPYYYKYEADLDNMESIEYGRVDEGSQVTITETSDFDNEKGFEINVLTYHSVDWVDSSVFAKDKISTKEEYDSAKQRCAAFLNEL